MIIMVMTNQNIHVQSGVKGGSEK